MNKLISILLISCIAMFSAKGQVIINEYSAANYDTYTDNYGEYEDWVELYNTTATAIDLNGWALSDKVSNPLKWIIPSSFIVPANGTAIVYCSGRDELVGGNAHANFKITQTKGNEVFMLSDAGGIFQDSIQVLPNQNSHTRGRETNGSPIWSVFTAGTPNTNNIGAMQEYAMTPVFSQAGGYNAAAINLTLSSPDPTITIYYTTNGDEPNNTSTIYTTPINIAITTVVKAIAYSSTTNIPSSFIDYHTFFINDTHTIPILSISGDNGQGGLFDLLDGNWGAEPDGTIEWFDKNGILIDKGTGEYNKHGNDSWAYDQRGFDYVMRDQFGYNYALQDKLFDTKSRDKFQKIIVKAAANDNYPFSYSNSGAHIRDAYVHHLSQLADLRLDERSTSSCILYLNGEYWGVYEMREKVDDSDFLNYYYDQDEIYRESAEYIQYLKTWAGTWTKYGGGVSGMLAEDDWDDFVTFVTTNPMTNQTNYNTAKGQFNTGSLIDYFLLNSYVVCGDWLNYNTGWWRGLDPNGDKKKWRYTLWDMDNTFDHGTNYTGVPTMSVNADPCDPSSLNNPGGQGHIPIWNEFLTNDDFFTDYVNRWQDLAIGDLSCVNMIDILDSMVAVIEPEMPGQIAKWGGNYATWQSNVQDMKDFILARCSIMNNGFIPCYPALSGPYNATVEIIGIGEIEMSDGNIINETNTPQIYSRFGGVALPFEVKSGNLIYWEILPAGVYVYDPFQDTLVIDVQGDVTVRAFFGESRNIVYDIVPASTTSIIDINGVGVNTFPHTEMYLLGDTINISPNIDPLYGFKEWGSDSVMLMPNPFNEVDSFYATNSDTIKLHLYLKPTIVYDIRPIGTTTTIDINGNIISVFPYSETCFIDKIVTLSPNIDPLLGFGSWSSDSNIFINGNSINNSFYGIYNDTIILHLTTITAGIYGNDTLCSNDSKYAELYVDFTGIPPYVFTYTLNGVIQDSIRTSDNPYIIPTTEDGLYILNYFRDANENGVTSGEAKVTILNAPVADFEARPDSMTILYTTTQMEDKSIGDIVNWEWYFGDNTSIDYSANPFHTYKDSVGFYEVTLIVKDVMGCIDTTSKILSITDDYWIYIPNSFTPDLDGVNDVFCLTHHGVRGETFYFNVYDRFSNLVYATENITDLECFLNSNGWDGKHFKTGNDLPMGTYIYEVYFQDFEGWKHQDRGNIFIIR